MKNTASLKSYVNRAIKVKQDIDEYQNDLAEIYKEADDAGFDKKAIKEVVKRAMMSGDEKQAAEQLDLLIETYWSNYQNGDEKSASRARTRPREYMADDQGITSMTISSGDSSVTVTSDEAREIRKNIEAELKSHSSKASVEACDIEIEPRGPVLHISDDEAAAIAGDNSTAKAKRAVAGLKNKLNELPA